MIQPSDSQSSLLSGNTTDSENLDDYRDFYLVGEQCIRATNFPWNFKPGTQYHSDIPMGLVEQLRHSSFASNSNHPGVVPPFISLSQLPASNPKRAAEFEQTVSADSTLWLIDLIKLT